ncbi:MAG TPA: branched-chain amino acid ABC transporter permease [Urbifossiella sp.]|nr:branched-chain amino acid ABC transporter permease [Urbifossiella sp.]
MKLRRVLGYWPAALFAAFVALPFAPGVQAALTAQDFIPLFIYAVLALGLNVIVGYTGLLHLGIAAFFGIGAYTTGILTVSQFPFQQSFLVAAIASVGAAAAIGVIATAPTLRLSGDYLALVTMAFGLIAVYVIRNLENITNGTKGLGLIAPTLLPGIHDPNFAAMRVRPAWGREWSAYPYFYFLCLAMLLAVYWFLGFVEQSRLGRSWVAMREDELAASCMGLNPAKLKLSAIALAAGIAGLAGALYGVSQTTTANPSTYDFNRSMLTICCIILGGLGNRPGVILGVFLLIGFDQVLTPIVDQWVQRADVQQQFPASLRGKEYMKISAWRLGIFGAVLIAMMRFRPAGLLPESRRKHELEPAKSA